MVLFTDGVFWGKSLCYLYYILIQWDLPFSEKRATQGEASFVAQCTDY